MKKIFYLLSLFLICLSGLNAQNTGTCNAGFTYYISQNQVYLMPVDSIGGVGFWTFGDGSNQVGLGASHSYAAPGTYIVTHSISDTTRHCQDTSSQTIQVNFTPGCSISMITLVDSVISGGAPVNPNQYTFIEYSDLVGSSIKSLLWTIDSSTVGTGQSLVYTFPAVGSYQVCAQLQTYSGCVATDCKNINVTRIDSCILEANFTYAALPSGNGSLAIQFMATPADSSLQYSWYFGDGSLSSAIDPTHEYSQKGIYSVSLAISKSYGTNSCQSNYSSTVYVNIGPADTCSLAMNYSANPTSPNTISFTVSGGQPFVSEEWTITKLPDSTFIATLSNINPTYQFLQTGSYEVDLLATAQSGCRNSAFALVNIDSISLNNASTTPHEAIAYPNPASNQVNLSIPLLTNATITVYMYNTQGTLIHTKQVQGVAGANQLALPVQNLSAGIYYIEIQCGNLITRSRFTKL